LESNLLRCEGSGASNSMKKIISFLAVALIAIVASPVALGLLALLVTTVGAVVATAIGVLTLAALWVILGGVLIFFFYLILRLLE
jgi:hypothetical protein